MFNESIVGSTREGLAARPGQLVLVERSLEDRGDNISDTCVSQLRPPFLTIEGPYLILHATRLYTALYGDEPRMYYGNTLIGPRQPIFMLVSDLEKGFLKITWGNDAVLERSERSETLTKHVNDFRKYTQIVSSP